MTDKIHFLTFNQVMAIHQRMIADFGGNASVRDQGMLEGAVTMPSQSWGGQYLHEDLSDMAAAYLFHICQNHAFIDGNKRTALACAEMFLLINDRVLTATNKELENLTLGVADGRVSKGDVVDFFAGHVNLVD